MIPCLGQEAEIAGVEAMEENANTDGTYTSLYMALNNLEDVRKLTVKKDTLKTFLDVCGRFVNLEHLYLHFGERGFNYQKLDSMQALQVLLISYSAGGLFPKSVTGLSKLKAFHILHCNMGQAPEDLFVHNALENINLEGNELQSLPSKIPPNKALRILSLRSNSLQKLPAHFPLLNKLEFLFLAHNKFTAIPQEIFAIRSLKVLNVAFNYITEIPADIAKLKNLEILYLTGNALKRLPSEMREMKNLKKIYLSEWAINKTEKELIMAVIPNHCEVIWTNENYFHSLEFEINLKE